jgi:MFS family permease
MRTWILTLLCLAAVIAYVQRNAISVPADEIRADLAITTAALGSVMSAFYLGYAVLQVPAGWLADRLGSRRALALFAATWSLFTLGTGLAPSYEAMLVLWCLMGLAQAGVFPASAKVIGDWFPDTQRAFAAGLLASSQAVGAFVAPLLTGQLLGVLTWRQIFALYALPGLLWALVFFLSTPASRAPGRHAPALGPTDWSRLWRSGPMALLCLQQFLRACAMVFFYTWFPTYLRATRGVSVSDAGTFTSWIAAGAVLGGLLGGHVSDWLLRRTGNRRLSRQGVAIVGMSACAVLAAAAYFVADTEIAILLLSLGAFWGTFGGVSGYSVAIEFGGQRVATVFSVMNMCGNIGAFLFPLAIGWFVDLTGRWDLVLFVFSACFAADAVCWALLNPRGTLFEESHDRDRHPAEPLPSGPGPR